MSKLTLTQLKHYLSQVKQIMRQEYQRGMVVYKQLSNKQRIVLFTGIGVIFLLFIAMSMGGGAKKPASSSKPPVYFDTKMPVPSKPIMQSITPVANHQAVQIQSQLSAVKQAAQQQYAAMNTQLQAMQSNMSSLASQRDMQALQQAVTAPNKALANKMDSLQSSVQTIVKQTEKKTWVNPKMVEEYFRLVAVQGFSDGMRTIIDVDGNQTTLSIHEICPACRGWVLQNMNFSNQSAVFAKQGDGQQQYVKLQAN